MLGYKDVLHIYELVKDDDYAYDNYVPLLQAIVNSESESGSEIWEALFHIIDRTFKEPTRDTNKGTRLTCSTARFQGADQKKEILKDPILEEVGPWTFRKVGGFIEKYFLNSTRANEIKRNRTRAKKIKLITTAMKNCKMVHAEKDGKQKLLDLPKSPEEWQVRAWFQKFNKCLSKPKGNCYHHTNKPGELKGGECSYQLDLFVARPKSDAAKGAKCCKDPHNWADVMVIGDLKKSTGGADHFAEVFTQLSVYVRQLFSVQPSRRFAHAFTLRGSKMEAWVFDRSGAYSSGPFDIHENAEQFIQIIAGYCLMSEEELGVDTFIKRTSDKWSLTFTDMYGGGDAKKTINASVDPNFIFRQRAIVSRGTVCYATKARDDTEALDDTECNEIEVQAGCVIKFSWVSDRRKSEASLLRLAEENAKANGNEKVKGVVKLVAGCEITEINKLRSDLTIKNKMLHPFKILEKKAGQGSNSRKRSLSVNSQHNASKRLQASTSHDEITSITILASTNQESESCSWLDNLGGELYSNRVLRCLVLSPAGKALYQYDSPLELVEAMRDAIRAHKSLYQEGGILHRDISENNIIITDVTSNAEGYRGMLIDLDLAKAVNDDPSGSHHRTGTMAFLAIGTLRNGTHTYRHDLESFFFVLLWQCARRGWDYEERRAKEEGRKVPKRPENSVLKGWYTGDFLTTADAKEHDLQRDAFELLLEEFPPSLKVLKRLCREFRIILFRTGSISDRLFIRTPRTKRRQNMLYEGILEAFDESIDRIK